MDHTPEQMKFIGFFGILSQSFKTIIKFKKNFAQITVTLILPLAITVIVHMSISKRFFYKFEENPYKLITGAYESYRSYYTPTYRVTPADWLNYILFKSTTIAVVTVFSLLSTTAVVYTIASVYTGRDVTYRKSMKAITKVWKRFIVTFICIYLTLLSYNLIFSVVVFLCSAVLGETGFYYIVLLAIFFPHFFGFLYLINVSQLASVVSVLESSSGIKAMAKATDLINGKRKVAIAILFIILVILAGVVIIYMDFILYDGGELAAVWRWMIGILTVILFTIVFLAVIVIQTVVYLVCKSYHRETIDPVSLSTYLGAYLSDSQPTFRVGEDIQLGRPQNQSLNQV